MVIKSPHIDHYMISRLTIKATVIKPVWYWCKDRHRSMEEKRESMNRPSQMGPTDFDKDDKIFQWGKKQSYEQMML